MNSKNLIHFIGAWIGILIYWNCDIKDFIKYKDYGYMTEVDILTITKAMNNFMQRDFSVQNFYNGNQW